MESSMDWVRYRIYPVDTSNLGDLEKGMKDVADDASHGYIWENQSFTFKRTSDHFGGLVDFAESTDDELMVVAILYAISKAFSVAITVEDCDGQFLLIEAADVLPEWLEPETSPNRVFIYQGALHIVPVEAFPEKPSLKAALEFIKTDPFRSRASAAIQKAILESIMPFSKKDFKHLQHRANVIVPREIAALLQMKPFLLPAAIHAFMNRSSKQTVKLNQRSEYKLADRVTTLVAFTKQQFAQLAFVEAFEAPKNYEMPPRSDPSYLACQLGLKLTFALEMTTNVKEQLDGIDLNELKLVTGQEDSVDWLNVDPDDLEIGLIETMKRMKMSEKEVAALMEEWNDEYDQGRETRPMRPSKLDEDDPAFLVKNDANPKKGSGGLQKTIKRLKSQLHGTSSYQGVESDSSNDSDQSEGSDFWDEENEELSDSSGDDDEDVSYDEEENEDDDDDEFLEFEILETLKHDPDLLMRIVEMNAHAGVSNAALMDQLQKLTKSSATEGKVKQKGLADIDPAKLEEVRKVPTRHLADHIEKEMKERIEKGDPNDEEDDDNDDVEAECLSSDNEEFEEHTPTLEELYKNVKKKEIILSDLSESDSEEWTTKEDAEAKIPEKMKDYYAMMDAELEGKLKSSDFVTDESGNVDVDLNLAKSILEEKMEGVPRGPGGTLLASTRKQKK